MCKGVDDQVCALQPNPDRRGVLTIVIGGREEWDVWSAVGEGGEAEVAEATISIMRDAGHGAPCTSATPDVDLRETGWLACGNGSGHRNEGSRRDDFRHEVKQW